MEGLMKSIDGKHQPFPQYIIFHIGDVYLELLLKYEAIEVIELMFEVAKCEISKNKRRTCKERGVGQGPKAHWFDLVKNIAEICRSRI